MSAAAATTKARLHKPRNVATDLDVIPKHGAGVSRRSWTISLVTKAVKLRTIDHAPQTLSAVGRIGQLRPHRSNAIGHVWYHRALRG